MGALRRPVEELQTQLCAGDAVQDQMGDVGDKNVGLVEVGAERILPLVVGLENMDRVMD